MSQYYKMIKDKKWSCLMMLISQQYDVNNYRETICDSFNLYPICRPALLDIFREVILDKYLPAYFNNRNKLIVEYEITINVFMKEINNLVDLENTNPDYASVDKSSKGSNISGSGFVCSVCHWALALLANMCIKYGHNIGVSETSLADKIGIWKEIKVISDIIDILSKTLDSKLSAKDSTTILLRSVSQHKSNLSWVLKHIGEQLFDGRIVDKMLDIITEESYELTMNCCTLQSCILTLNYLGPNHIRLMQNLIRSKFELAITKSSSYYNYTVDKKLNYTCLMYFTLLMASSTENNELLGTTLTFVSSLLRQFSPKHIEMFLLQQNCILPTMKVFFHSIINICLHASIPEINSILDYLEIHSNHLCFPIFQSIDQCNCSTQFSRVCSSIIHTISGQLIIRSHSVNGFISSSNTNQYIPTGLAACITNNSSLWMNKIINRGSVVAAQLLVGAAIIQSPQIGEDILSSIIIGPRDKSDNNKCKEGHQKALGLFSMILTELEIGNPDILQKVFNQVISDTMLQSIPNKLSILENIIYLIRRESVLNSQRRRIARALNSQIDQLLLLIYGTLTNNPYSKYKYQFLKNSACLLMQLDALSDEKYSVPVSSHPFIPVIKQIDQRYKSMPIYISARIIRCTIGIVTVLFHLFEQPNYVDKKLSCLLRIYVQFLLNFIRTSFRGHTIMALQIVLREYQRYYKIDNNNTSWFKKRLKHDWFITPLLHDYGPEKLNSGKIMILKNSLLNKCHKNSTLNIYTLFIQQYWEYIIFSISNFYEQFDNKPITKPGFVIHWTLRQCLIPDYHLYINPVADASPREVNSIVMVWRRFKSHPILWNCLSQIADIDASNLKPPFQTCEILMSACRYLWSTADCPRIKLNINSNTTQQYISDLFIADSQDPDTLKGKRPIEIVDSKSELFQLTIKLLDVVSAFIPLAGELVLLLGYLSPAEVQAILTHLLLNWRQLIVPTNESAVSSKQQSTLPIQPSNEEMKVDLDDTPLPPNPPPPPPPPSQSSENSISFESTNDNEDQVSIANSTDNSINNTSSNNNNNNQSLTTSPPPPQQQQLSWDTVLSSIIHTRVHCNGLYDQFYRLLSMEFSHLV